MKYFLVLIFLNVNILIVNCQDLSGTVTYKLSKTTDTISNVTSSTEGTLFFNLTQNKSVYITDRVFKPEPIEYSSEKKDDGTVVMKKTSKSGDKIGKVLYKNYAEKKLVFRDGFMSKAYIIKDSYPDINWQLLDSSKSIKGLICQKAEGDFRGRHYTAWFTNKIPVPDGPWKLCGLPGLILEAYDEKKHFIFECISLDFPQKIDEELKQPSSGEEIDFISYWKLYRQAQEDAYKKIYAMIAEHGGQSYNSRFGSNFLERNFEK